jgi:hypothetical protein
MKTPLKLVLIGSAALGLAACAESWHRFNNEAGVYLNDTGFGDATMNNLLAQKCAGRSKGYVVPEPVVVLDPNSTPSQPAYYRGQVRCSGELNGKYAQVIFREYVESAEPAHGGSALIEVEAE